MDHCWCRPAFSLAVTKLGHCVFPGYTWLFEPLLATLQWILIVMEVLAWERCWLDGPVNATAFSVASVLGLGAIDPLSMLVMTMRLVGEVTFVLKL